MFPTLEDGDLLIVNRTAYKDEEIQRFDIIVFESEFEENNEKEYVKRVIGLPGETVQIYEGKIYINAEELSEFYGYEDYIENIGNIGISYCTC
jgi:signal peptidase I